MFFYSLNTSVGAHLIFTQYFSLLFEVAEKACEMFNKFLYAMNCYFRNLFVHLMSVNVSCFSSFFLTKWALHLTRFNSERSSCFD